MKSILGRKYWLPCCQLQVARDKRFYRADKLKSYVIIAHNESTLFSGPVAGCLSACTPLSGTILALHIRNHDNRSCKAYWSYFKALQSCGESRTCPIINCLKKLYQGSLQEHVLRYTEVEGTAFRTEMTAAGLDHFSGYLICDPQLSDTPSASSGIPR